MAFILHMALRELRASWKRLVFFFICIAVGVGSIVFLRSLIQNVNGGLKGETRALLAADIEIGSSRPWSKEFPAALDQSLKTVGQGRFVRQDITETPTMAAPVLIDTPVAQRIELKGVPDGYPFYGTIALSDGKRFSSDLLAEDGVLVQPSLLTQLNLKIGDRIKIGNESFTIRDVITDEPGSGLNAFSFGPRVLISRTNFEKTGLISYGTQARYRILLQGPDALVDPLTADLKQRLRDQRVTVRSYRTSQDQLDEQLTQAENFLSLVGLVVLLLGGIGISSVIHVFIRQKIKTIAVLKCLGTTGVRVTATYIVQVLILASSGSLLGIGLAWIGIRLVKLKFAALLPKTVAFGLTLPASLQGFGVGLLIAVLFSILPLLDIRTIKPNLLLRNEFDAVRKRFEPLKIVTGLLVVAGLIAVCAWQAGSLRVGATFLIALGVTAGLLNLVSLLAIRTVRGLRRIPFFPLRHGVNSLYRPGNQTRVIVVATGLGAFFIIGIQSVQQSLLRELDISSLINASDMFLINIQKDQTDGLRETIKSSAGVDPDLVPTLRARLVAFNNKDIDLDKVGNGTDRGRLGREYTVTYRPKLGPNEKIVGGTFWDATPSKDPEVSIEESLFKNYNLKVGDTLTVDILGQKITARITSLRKVDWRNSRTGFVILFRPGTLDDAPQTLITGIKAPADVAARTRLQGTIVKKFPNITVIDVVDILNRTRSIIGTITLAISIVGGFVFFCGVLILIGSISLTKYHRTYEAAILKTLGAKNFLIATTLVVEYGLLGLVAGGIGSAAAVGLSWAVTTRILRITWEASPGLNLIGIVVAAAIVMTVGVLSSLDVMVKKPLGILRAD